MRLIRRLQVKIQKVKWLRENRKRNSISEIVMLELICLIGRKVGVVTGLDISSVRPKCSQDFF